MKIGLMGLGTVGSGVYEIINYQKGNYFVNSNEEVYISKVVVRDKNKPRNIEIPHDILVTDYEDLINDKEIDVIIFVMGGMEPAYSNMIKAMNNGKHVITANKEVVSEYIRELEETAQKNNVLFLFEASVGGGIPIISSLKQTLKINQIDEIKGILNGTTNFILSKMSEEGSDFQDTLKLAQELGFAEADPTADIEGYDVSRKLSILSSLAFGSHIRDENIYKRGITDIIKSDMDMFKDLDLTLKYLAHSKLEGDDYYASVEPILLSKGDIMSNVNEEFNIVSINGNIIGELQFYGKGAGKNATANAVVADLLYIINNEVGNGDINLDKELNCKGISKFSGKYYLRTNTRNHSEFEQIIDIVHEYSLNKKVVFNKSQVFVLTESINADIFNQLINKLKEINIDLFYARIVS